VVLIFFNEIHFLDAYSAYQKLRIFRGRLEENILSIVRKVDCFHISPVNSLSVGHEHVRENRSLKSKPGQIMRDKSIAKEGGTSRICLYFCVFKFLSVCVSAVRLPVCLSVFVSAKINSTDYQCHFVTR